FQVKNNASNQNDKYPLLLKQLSALLEDEKDFIASLANASALLNQFLDEINWVGFYIWKDDELVLGPFQGLPACVRIPYGIGVCGTALKEQKTQRVENVHEFPGHIACDQASKSELVIPMFIQEQPYALLDIDSPIYNRFDETDQLYLEKFVYVLNNHIHGSNNEA